MSDVNLPMFGLANRVAGEEGWIWSPKMDSWFRPGCSAEVDTHEVYPIRNDEKELRMLFNARAGAAMRANVGPGLGLLGSSLGYQGQNQYVNQLLFGQQCDRQQFGAYLDKGLFGSTSTTPSLADQYDAGVERGLYLLGKQAGDSFQSQRMANIQDQWRRYIEEGMAHGMHNAYAAMAKRIDERREAQKPKRRSLVILLYRRLRRWAMRDKPFLRRRRRILGVPCGWEAAQ